MTHLADPSIGRLIPIRRRNRATSPQERPNKMLTHRHQQLTITIVRLTAFAISLIVLTVLIVTTSRSAFSATTDTASNSFGTGTVVLTDDDAGNSLFTASGMSPGTPIVECISVTYSGTLVPADVRMYGVSTGALAPYLDTTIEIGTGGSFGDCTGFVSSSTVFTGTLAAFSTVHTNWATGQNLFTATTNPTLQTVRFTIDVQNDAAAQGLNSTADFIFEAQD